MTLHINRRQCFQWGAGALTGFKVPAIQAQASKPLYLADMHSHYGMFLPRLFGFDLTKQMRESGTTLLAWAIVDDQRWMVNTPNGFKQQSIPKTGELWSYFQARVAEYEGRLSQWRATKALTEADVDAAISGQPRVLLATEAANFLEGDLTRLDWAHAIGVRHLQLVHYIQSPIGDHQTAEPSHGGLTALGSNIVAQCKRLGIVVDLAHGTASLVDAALDASNAPMVWSHSWISPAGGAPSEAGWMARSLALPTAKKIAHQGGAVGLWNLRVRNDPAYRVSSISSYADEIMRMCDLIGPKHVAFGTDLEGTWPGRIMTSYADLREVAENLAKRGLSEAELNGVFIGNYANIVKSNMRAVQ